MVIGKTLYKNSDNTLLYISAVSIYELHMGATTPEKIKDVLYITEDRTILSFDDQVAVKASQIYYQISIGNSVLKLTHC